MRNLRPNGVTSGQTVAMKRRGAAVVVAFLLAGCGGGANVPEGSTDYECVPRIRLDGVIYRGYGYTHREATRQLGTADEAACHDVGRDAPSSDFLDDPKQVGVWAFAGYAAGRVLGVRFGEGSFSVFIAESVSRSEGDRILSELSVE